MRIASTAFQNNEPIPETYSRDGKDISPPLTFSEVPKEAKSLALIMEDPDAPNGTFTHWVLFNMLPATLQILEGEIPEDAAVGVNDFGEAGYGGPQPPSGTHRYVFKLFALDRLLPEMPGVTAEEIYRSMQDSVLDTAELTGTYSASQEEQQTV